MWWMKKIRKRKMQSMLIVLIVALCTTLISGSFVILTSLTSVYSDLVTDTNAPDVKIYGRSNLTPEDMREKVKGIDGVEDVEEVQEITITTIVVKDEKKDVFIDICEYNETVYEKVRIISGSLDDIGGNRCAIPQVIASDYELEIGDHFQTVIGNQSFDYEIVCTFAEIFSAANQYTCDVLVKELPESESEIQTNTVLAVYLEEGVTGDDLIARYTADNDGILDAYFRTAEDCIVNAELTELILGGILLGISSVVFLAILIILSYIVKNSLHTDKKTIAIYKTMGYKNGTIRGIYVTFYMSLMILGTLIGSFCSPLLSGTFVSTVYRNIGVSGGIGGLPQIILCGAIICLCALGMLVVETAKMMKYKPVDILNDMDIRKKADQQKKKNQFRFSPFAMAFTMLKRDVKNTLLLMIICVFSIYIVNLSLVCLQNIDLIQGETNYYWLGIDKHDVTVENASTAEEFNEICKLLEHDPDVERVTRRTFDMGFAIPYHQMASSLIFETFEGIELPLVKGRNPQTTDEVTVGNIYLKELGIDVGDYITVQLGSSVRKDLLVVGSFQGFYNMGRVIRICGDLLTENGIDFDYNQCSVNLKKGVDKAAFMERVQSAYDGKIKLTDRLNLYSSIMKVICAPQKAALRPFAALTVIIGALNAFYIVYASNLEKRKKYTIYKSIGYTSGHLIAVNVIYVGMIALVATAVAIPAFIFLFPKIMVLSMSAFGFAEYRLEIMPMTLALTNGMMLLIFLISAVLAGLDIRKNYIAKIMNE